MSNARREISNPELSMRWSGKREKTAATCEQSFTVKNEKKRWDERKRSASSSANYLVHFCRQPFCFPHTSCYPSFCPCSSLCSSQLISSSLFLFLLSQLLSSLSPPPPPHPILSLSPHFQWQLDRWCQNPDITEASVCECLHLSAVCLRWFMFAYACVLYTQPSVWGVFSCVHQYFWKRVEFLLRCICRGGNRITAEFMTHLSPQKHLNTHWNANANKKHSDILGPQPVYENVASPRCLCTHEYVYLFSAYLYVCVCRPASAWIPFCVMRGGTSVSQWASLKAHQQRQVLPARVRSHVCACARLSLPNVLSCDQIQVHDSNITPLLLLSFCLSLFHTNSHFHLMLSTARSVLNPILASATFNLFLSLCNTHTHTLCTACSWYSFAEEVSSTLLDMIMHARISIYQP